MKQIDVNKLKGVLQVFNAYFSVILELRYHCVKLYMAGYELEALARGLGWGEMIKAMYFESWYEGDPMHETMGLRGTDSL